MTRERKRRGSFRLIRNIKRKESVQREACFTRWHIGQDHPPELELLDEREKQDGGWHLTRYEASY